MAKELHFIVGMSAARNNHDDEDSDGAIHKMDTLPPPAGEDDAYNAATKIGPLARGLVQAMMAKSEADETLSSMPPPASMTRDLSLPRPARVPALAVSEEVERLYEDVEEGDIFEPTALLDVAPISGTASQPTTAPRSLAAEQETRAAAAPLEVTAPSPEQGVLAPPTELTAPRPAPMDIAAHQARTRQLEMVILFGAILVLALFALLGLVVWLK